MRSSSPEGIARDIAEDRWTDAWSPICRASRTDRCRHRRQPPSRDRCGHLPCPSRVRCRCCLHWTPADHGFPGAHGPDGPATIQAELEASGVRVADLAVDFALPGAAERVLDGVTEALGVPDILVNNAVYDPPEPDGFATVSAASLDAAYAVNLRTTVLLCAGSARRRVAWGGSAPTGVRGEVGGGVDGPGGRDDAAMVPPSTEGRTGGGSST